MNDHSSLYNRQQLTSIHLLEQLTDREFWHYAQRLAIQHNPLLSTDEDALECQTEQGRYLFPLRALCEVIAPPHKITLLPLHPPWMSGITAWRDHVIPVVDLASYFTTHTQNEQETPPHPPSSNSMLLILGEANNLLALQIQLVGSIVTLQQAQLASPKQAPSWYPQRLLFLLLGVYAESVLLNSHMLVDHMLQHIKVSNAYE